MEKKESLHSMTELNEARIGIMPLNPAGIKCGQPDYGAPGHPKFYIKYMLEPLVKIGKDHVDVIDLGANKYALTLIDISGEGKTVGLSMAMACSFIQTDIAPETNLAEFIADLNAYLFEHTPEDIHTAIFLGILDAVSSEIEYVIAGYPTPLVVQGCKTSFLATEQTPYLGATPTIDPEVKKITLDHNSGLFIYSDGFSECFDGKPKQTLDALFSHSCHRSPEYQALFDLNWLYNKVTGEAAKKQPLDDIALLYVSRCR